MPLLAIWHSTPAVVEQFTIEQVVSAAGNGDLRDGSECSSELRTLFGETPTRRLADYIEQCLMRSFAKSGQVLQDLVNELGRRLDYVVENGRYQGVVNGVGFDGIWRAPEGNHLIIETKTTDAYRLSLDKLADYRRSLAQAGRITTDSSILIVTGRVDTGELEAQIRGSRHAWDVRLISADALLNLVDIKEATDSKQTVEKMRRLLMPMEFTRLDKLIDVIFTTARDVESAAKAEVAETTPGSTEDSSDTRPGWQFTEPKLLNAKRELILDGFSRKMARKFIKYSRALFWDAAHEARAAITLSKRYDKKGQSPYWYAYHPQWDKFLGEGEGFFVLGCIDRASAYAIPVAQVRQWLPSFLTSQTKDGSQYWHIKLVEPTLGKLAISLPKSQTMIPLSAFEFPISTEIIRLI